MMLRAAFAPAHRRRSGASSSLDLSVVHAAVDAGDDVALCGHPVARVSQVEWTTVGAPVCGACAAESPSGRHRHQTDPQVPAWATDFARSAPGEVPLPDVFRLALRTAAVALMIVSPDGRVLASNPETWRLTGRSEESLVGFPLQELLLAPKDVSRAWGTAAGDRAQVDVALLHADSTVRHAELLVSPVLDDDGDILAHLAVLHDTEEAVLRLAEMRKVMADVVNTMIDPWVLLAPVRHGDAVVDFRFVDANDAACRHNGVDRPLLIGESLLTLLPEHATNGLLDAFADVMATGVPLVLNDHPFGATSGSSLRFFDNRGNRVGEYLSFTWRDVTERVEARRRLAAVADADPLTGVYNRGGFLRAASAAVTTGTRRVGDSCGILFCDLDGLKAVNDRLGHACGDAVIVAVAERLAATIRRGDVLGRLGGDEFVVLAVGLSTDSSLESLRRKLGTAVRPPVTAGDVEVRPAISVGAVLMSEGEEIESAVARADEDLYRRKGGGRATTWTTRP